MWDYASPYERGRGEENESVCEIYFDKWISFVHKLFDRWKEVEVTHSLTVVFFSRTFLSSRQAIAANASGGSIDCKDVYGRPFEVRELYFFFYHALISCEYLIFFEFPPGSLQDSD